MNKLIKKTIVGSVLFIGMIGIALFAPAWTLNFWQAWVFLGVFAASHGLINLYLWKKDPKLLERRAKGGLGGEKEKNQKLIWLFLFIIFMGMFILASLDHRFSWSEVQPYVVIAGDGLVALGFFMMFRVFKENTFTGATVELAVDQKVISTGPYALVRHPYYAGDLVLHFGTPLALGSWWALLLFIPFTLVIVWRLLEEEKFLIKELPGYSEYFQKVRYRLVPFVF
ncbi:MAG: methyltransferase family protein [Desulfobaccales bacterium]